MALGPYTIKEVEYFVKRATAPEAYLNSESRTTPMTPADELQALGVKMVIVPLALTMAKIHAMRETLQVIRTNKADTRIVSGRRPRAGTSLPPGTPAALGAQGAFQRGSSSACTMASRTLRTCSMPAASAAASSPASTALHIAR